MTDERESQLMEELNWVRPRAMKAGVFRMDPSRDWGISSNALVEFAVGGVEPGFESYPADWDDLEACRRAAAKAPAHLRERCSKLLLKYAARLGEPPSVERESKDRRGLTLDEAAEKMKNEDGLVNS